MKIVRFTAENIKKLKVVEIVPDGSVVQITGPNGSGKSSVLDAIYYALAGTSHIPSQPVRSGTEKARITLDLGEVVVTRRFTETGTSLVVEASNGARFPSPQKMLDDLLGALAFDPLEFSRMEPRKQLDTLRRLVPLEQDIDALDAANKADYDTRTGVNRRVKELQAQVDAIKVDPHLPGEPVDVSALTAELQEAADKNVELERQRAARAKVDRAVEEADDAIKSAQDDLTDAKDELKRAEKVVKDCERELAAKKQELADMKKERDAAPPLPEPVDTTDLRARIDAAGATNKAIDMREGRKALQKKLKAAEEESQALTRDMDERAALKEKTIAAAAMPVPGLGFGDGAITYNGLPFDQASSAEQLRVSVAIAMAANPKLRVIRIKDGSLLDESNLALIADMAKAGDYQVWIERVDTSGKVGVVMEDGHVKEVQS